MMIMICEGDDSDGAVYEANWRALMTLKESTGILSDRRPNEVV